MAISCRSEKPKEGWQGARGEEALVNVWALTERVPNSWSVLGNSLLGSAVWLAHFCSDLFHPSELLKCLGVVMWKMAGDRWW